MVNRITVILEQPEYSALLKWAVEDLRNPQDQLRYIFRQALQQRADLRLTDTRAKYKTEAATDAIQNHDG